CVTRESLHFGALEEHGHAIRMLVDDTVLAVFHLGIIQAWILALNSLPIGVNEAFPNVGGLEQSFCGDTTHEEARASEPGLLFDQRCFQSVLSGPNGRGVAARTTPNNNQIVWHLFHSTVGVKWDRGKRCHWAESARHSSAADRFPSLP